MLRRGLLCLLLTPWAVAQGPFQPLDLGGAGAVPDRASARRDWVKITNQRMEMTGRTLRVALEGDGQTVVVLAKGVDKPRHAKPILLGKGVYAELFQSVKALGFSRIVARNPDSGRQRFHPVPAPLE